MEQKISQTLSQEMAILREFMNDKFSDMQEQINRRFDSNKDDHDIIMKKQDKTNGNVADLIRWKWYFMGGAAIIVPAIFWLIKLHLKS